MRDVRLTELQGIHVLVIDDDLHARHYLRSVLELWGAIVTATSGEMSVRVSPMDAFRVQAQASPSSLFSAPVTASSNAGSPK